MLFSVIVPVFNSQNYLRNCLSSIINQSFTDFEIIVIDDGSTDNSVEILKEFSNEYSFIHVYHFENSGVSNSRKRGISLSNGKYVIFVDSDDTINKDLLFNLSKTITAHNNPTIIRYQANLIGDLESKDHNRYNFNNDLNEIYTGTTALRHWSIENKKYAVYWLFAFSRELFSNFFFVTDLRCYEDVALIPILIAAAKQVVNIEYVGYNYTVNNSESLTNIRTEEAEYQRALDFIEAYNYAITNFVKLSTVTPYDIAFFVMDYTRRLKGKFDSLPENLKQKLEPLFKI